MPGEVVSLQVGQCGNQVALQYWAQLADEHNINADGTSNPVQSNQITFESASEMFQANPELKPHRSDQTNVFFSQSDNKYTPRSISSGFGALSNHQNPVHSLPMFNPRNIHLSENGTGAANNWKQGYHYAAQHEEELLNLLDRELDKCDNLSAFQLFHSVAGGTGSGVGSYLLELLDDRYGSKKMITTFLIFPSSERTSDVVVQPYNTVLTLKRLIDHSDATFVFDNDSLNRLDSVLRDLDRTRSAFEGENKLISYVAAGISNPLRFPSYMYSSYESIISSLIPTPELKFLTSSIAPFSNTPGHVHLQESEIILELLNDRYKMNHVFKSPSYISMLDFIIGDNLNQNEIRKGLVRAQPRVRFVPWTSSSIHVVNGRKTYSASATTELSGFQVSNNTSIAQLFANIVSQYDRLAKRAAYINFYTESNDSDERTRVLDAFNECKESIVSTIEEYTLSEGKSYLDEVFLDQMMD